MMLLVLLTATSLLIGKSQQSIPLHGYRGPWAPLSGDGTVIDTSEVAQAKTAHLAAHVAARLVESRAELSPTARSDTTTEVPSETNGDMTSVTLITQRDYRQKSVAPLGQDGQVVDTPEVAVAKAKHLATHARTVATAATADQELEAHVHGNLLYLTPVRLVSSAAYRGSPAPLGPDGQVVDTPEVTVARAAHMKAHARAVALTAGYNVYY